MIIPVYGKDVTTCSGIYSYPTNDNEQWRFIYVVKDPQWTPLKVVPGQPTNGTYVEKGNFLFYGESGGESVTISFGVSLGPQYANASANVGISIPLGTVSYLGQGFKAKKSGRYLIKVKKEVQPTITFIQYRRKVNNSGANGENHKYIRLDMNLKRCMQVWFCSNYNLKKFIEL